GAFQVVLAHGGAGSLVDLVLGERDLHAHDVSGVEQTVGVRFKAENGSAIRGVVGTNTFEHAHAVMQGMGQHVGSRVAPRHQFAVIPNHAITIGHRHSCLLLNRVHTHTKPGAAAPHSLNSVPAHARCAAHCGVPRGTGP